jgi:hypothetical protein
VLRVVDEVARHWLNKAAPVGGRRPELLPGSSLNAVGR